MEFGYKEDLKRQIKRLIEDKFARTGGELKLEKARNIIRLRRLSGSPVLVELDYPVEHDPVEALQSIREMCKELMVIYTTSPEDVSIEPVEYELIQKLPPLGREGYLKLTGVYGTLLSYCDQDLTE
jgi:hypothetical protein